MKVTIYECFDPNTYDSDLEDLPYEIEGYRYIINYGAHVIIGKMLFKRKEYCIQAMRRALKKYCINIPDNFTITQRPYSNLEFIV